MLFNESQLQNPALIAWMDRMRSRFDVRKCERYVVNGARTTKPPGTGKPAQIISLMKYEDTDNTMAMGDHDDHIHVGFTPLGGTEAGRRLAWGSTDSTVKVWDGPGTEIKVLRGHTSWVQAVTFSPDDKWIASASLDGTVKIWRTPPILQAGEGDAEK